MGVGGGPNGPGDKIVLRGAPSRKRPVPQNVQKMLKTGDTEPYFGIALAITRGACCRSCWKDETCLRRLSRGRVRAWTADGSAGVAMGPNGQVFDGRVERNARWEMNGTAAEPGRCRRATRTP